MGDRLRGKRLALFVEDGYEEFTVTGPLEALVAEGASVALVGASAGGVYRDRSGSASVTADLAAGPLKLKDIDAIVIPGGYAPDKMRLRHAMVDLVTDAVAAGKPVAAIDRGAQVLISARVVRGRTLTCWPSIAIDVINAGGLYVDRPAVNDHNVITARKADDLPAFSEAIIAALQ